MKYLFWNTHKNDDINDVLSELIIENNISMVLLAEYAANADELINKLNSTLNMLFTIKSDLPAEYRYVAVWKLL